MAKGDKFSCFKPTGRKKYRIEFVDQHDRPRTIPAFKDGAASRTLGRKLVEDVARLKAGLQPLYAEVTGEHLGLIQGEARRPIAEVIIEHQRELVRRGSPADGKHVAEAGRILTKIATACNWTCLADIRADHFSRYLADLAEAGKRPRTQHGHQAKLKAFLNWCCQQGWLASNPIANIKQVKVGQKGRRRIRRALTPEEFQRLCAAAGDEHRRCYEVAVFSGFRRKELEQMTRVDAAPEGDRPRWHVRPEITKNGQGGELPMLPDCAQALLPRWRVMAPAAPS